MKKYKLLKDLPTFKAGDKFFISENGNLIAGTPEKPKKILIGDGDGAFILAREVDLIAYAKETLEKFPNILTDWFEEIKESFFYIDIFGNIIEGKVYVLNAMQRRKAIGNYFETKEQAEKHLEWLKARAVLLKDIKPFDGYAVEQWAIYFQRDISELRVSSVEYFCPSDVMFYRKEDAEASIKNHGKEWKIYLGVE